MKQFDSHRFATLVKWHLVSNRRELLNSFFFLTIVFFVMMMFLTQVVHHGDSYVWQEAVLVNYSHSVHQSMDAALFCIAVILIGGASRIFRNMKETRQRTTFLMLPASNLEKWLLRFLHATLLLFLLASLALVTADVVRMLLAPLWNRPLVSGVALLLSDIGGGQAPADDVPTALITAAVVGVVLLQHATFVLGGTLFRKSPFLLTCLAVFLLSVLTGQLLHDTEFSNGLTLVGYDDRTGLYVSPWIHAGTIGCYLVAVLFYWLSYKLFCRMQVINNKWLNV